MWDTELLYTGNRPHCAVPRDEGVQGAGQHQRCEGAGGMEDIRACDPQPHYSHPRSEREGQFRRKSRGLFLDGMAAEPDIQQCDDRTVHGAASLLTSGVRPQHQFCHQTPPQHHHLQRNPLYLIILSSSKLAPLYYSLFVFPLSPLWIESCCACGKQKPEQFSERSKNIKSPQTQVLELEFERCNRGRLRLVERSFGF